MNKTEAPHTATEAQIHANRENAQKSSGPRTAEGKAASSRNGLKHGLRAGKHILPGEDPDDFLLLVQDLLDRFRPVGAGEEKLVLRIAADQWRLDRAFPMEAGIYRDRFHDVSAKDELRQRQYANRKRDAETYGEPVPPPPTPPDEADLLARAFDADCAGPNSLTKLARYETSIERSIDRCLRQLKAFQAVRNTPDPRPEGPPEPSNPAPDPPSTPSNTADYQTNPKDAGHAQSCTSPHKSLTPIQNPAPRTQHPSPRTCYTNQRMVFDHPAVRTSCLPTGRESPVVIPCLRFASLGGTHTTTK